MPRNQAESGEGWRPFAAQISIDGEWQQVARLTPGENSAQSMFGSAVAISGGTIVVGAPEDREFDFDGGAVHVFGRQPNGDWDFSSKLAPSDLEYNCEFGNALDIEGDTMLVGSHLDDLLGDSSHSGSAYVFTREPNGTWIERQKLHPREAEVRQRFGFAVALSGELAVIGMEHEDHVAGEDPGFAWVFTRNGNVWLESDQLRSGDGIEGDLFGSTVAVDAFSVVVGAPGDPADGPYYSVGAAFAYSSEEVGCVADWNGDGELNSADFLAFLNTWAAERTEDCSSGNCASDVTADGVVDTRDFVAYLNLWAGGCN